MEEFQIKSPLLHAAIWGGTGCYLMDGYMNADKGFFGRALIEYFTAKLFNIIRVPGFEPFYLNMPNCYMLKHSKIMQKEFIEAYEEFKMLYEFTQKKLKEKGIVKDGKIRLNRSLRPFETDEILPQILNEDREIEYPSNIITSYAHDGILYTYGSWMSVVRDVPSELIIMYDEFLCFPPAYCRNRDHGGESEVWVVEENIFGYTKLPVECFEYISESIPKEEREKAQENIGKIEYNKKAEYSEGSLFSSQSADYLPCKGNRIIEYLVKRNNKKQREYWASMGLKEYKK